jgi:hypothetical protein
VIKWVYGEVITAIRWEYGVVIIYGINYTDLIGIYGSNYSDKIGKYTSNYVEKLTSVTSLIDKFSPNDFSLINNKIFPIQPLGYYSKIVRYTQATYSYINATTGLTVNVRQPFTFSYNDRISNGSSVLLTNKESNPYIYPNYNGDPSYNKYKVYYNDGDKILIKIGDNLKVDYEDWTMSNGSGVRSDNFFTLYKFAPNLPVFTDQDKWWDEGYYPQFM